ncbi:putative Flagellar radial spoke protein 3 [Blattamonas nauphoetae]|uniref:Flagellar radial spoke protein 3 n=1 Tax=Blattamonas nauphoetae TaxID=2049346 RepID=A0ABQ9XKM1_9EUKA|nr:putative Flagellar radial spoke protein 3 [Blattamonas nauphoetae]
MTSGRSVGTSNMFRAPGEKPRNIMSDPRVYRGVQHARPIEAKEHPFLTTQPIKDNPSAKTTSSKAKSRGMTTGKVSSSKHTVDPNKPETYLKSKKEKEVPKIPTTFRARQMNVAPANAQNSHRQQEQEYEELSSSDEYEIIEGDKWEPTPEERPPTPPYFPPPYGTDKQTQIDLEEIFDFDYEVVPFLELIVGRALEQAMQELAESEDHKTMKEGRTQFENLRNAELAENQRWVDSQNRRIKERDTRHKQFAVHAASEEASRRRRWANEQARFAMESATNTARVTFIQQSSNLFTSTGKHDIEQFFFPWLQDKVNKKLEKTQLARSVAQNLLVMSQQKAQERLAKKQYEDSQRLSELKIRGEMQKEDLIAKKDRQKWLPAVEEFYAERELLKDEDAFSQQLSQDLREAMAPAEGDLQETKLEEEQQKMVEEEKKEEEEKPKKKKSSTKASK